MVLAFHINIRPRGKSFPGASEEEEGRALALSTNIRLGWKLGWQGLQETNVLAYSENSQISDKKKVYEINTRGPFYKTFYGRKLRLFIIS
jgi:hypothetical protein